MRAACLRDEERGAAEARGDLERALVGPELELAADRARHRVAAGARVRRAEYKLVLPQPARTQPPATAHRSPRKYVYTPTLSY